jgi:hypothetical protein
MLSREGETLAGRIGPDPTPRRHPLTFAGLPKRVHSVTQGGKFRQ